MVALADANAQFYGQYPHFPLVHSLRGGNAFGRPWRYKGGSRRHHSRKARKARHDFFFHRVE